MYFFIVIWVIAILTIVAIVSAIGPIFEQLCIEKAKEIATKVINVETSKVIKDVDYNDLIMVEKDAAENVRMVKSNVILINLLASDMAYNIQVKLSELEKEKIKMPLGALTGIRILAGIGPDIILQVVPVGNIETEFKSAFVAAGVNQTIHRLYLIINCEVNILTPYNIINTQIKNEVLFAENLIVGDVPDTFYNLEGLEARDSMETIN